MGIFFDKNGKRVLRLNGYANIKNLNTALDYVKMKRYKLMSYKDYLVEKSKKSALIREPDLFKDSKNFMRTENSKKMAVFFESTVCEECKPLHNKLKKHRIEKNKKLDQKKRKHKIIPEKKEQTEQLKTKKIN